MAFGNITFWLLKKQITIPSLRIFCDFVEHPWQEAELFRDLLRKQHYRMGGHEKLLVLDAGCGNGRHIPELEKGGAEVVGIDQSEKLIECARKNIREEHFSWETCANYHFQMPVSMPYLRLRPFPISPQNTHENKPSRNYSCASPGGLFGGTAWNLNQERFRQTRKRAIWRRFFLPWWSKRRSYSLGKQKIPRLYHAFSAEDIQILLAKLVLKMENVQNLVPLIITLYFSDTVPNAFLYSGPL